MAITVNQGTEVYYLLGVQAAGALTTAVSEATALVRLRGIEPANFGHDIQEYEMSRADGCRQPAAHCTIHSASGSMGTIVVTMPYHSDIVKHFARVFFQAEAAGVYTFADDIPNEDELISLTIYKVDPVADRTERLHGIIGSGFKLSGERGTPTPTMMTFEGTGMGTPTADLSIPTGSIQTSGSAPNKHQTVPFTKLTFSLDTGTDATAVLSNWEVNLAYSELIPMGSDGAGGCTMQAQIIGTDSSVSITANKDATTYAAIARANDGNQCKFTIAGAFDLWATFKAKVPEDDFGSALASSVTGTLYTDDITSDMVSFTP